MASPIIPKIIQQDINGNPAVGWKLSVFEVGTSTPKASYSDAALTTLNSNPVILDSLGMASVYYDGVAKLVMKDSADVTKWEEPNVGNDVDIVKQVDTLADLKTTPITRKSVYVLGRTNPQDGYEGHFQWRTGDYTTQIAADTQEAIIVKHNDYALTVGAWRRDYSGAVKVEWFNALAAGDNTTSFSEAFAAADIVTAGSGTFTVKNLSVPNDKTFIGSGDKTIIINDTAVRCFSTISGSNIKLDNFALNCDSSAVNAVYFQQCDNAKAERIKVSGVLGHSLHFDGCTNSAVYDIRPIATGTTTGVSCVNFSNASATGSHNNAAKIYGKNSDGRLLTFFGQNYSHAYDINHQAKTGEVFLMEDCIGCTGTLLTQIGGNFATTGSLSDGCAINGGCENCSLDLVLGIDNAGHTVSVNGQTGKTGAKGNTVSNVRSIRPDEGGVILSDQGVAGSFPVGNVVSNCYVEDAAVNLAAEAFGVSGGTDNQFINCYAVDTRGTKKTTHGFLELNGLNTASNNHFSGLLDGTFLTATTALAAANSTISLKTTSQVYTLNATAVVDRTLLASASATTINNNNVLAALILDLQAKGILR